MKPKVPCLNCPGRKTNCHSSCDSYLKYRMELDEYNSKVAKQRQFNNDYYLYKESKYK